MPDKVGKRSLTPSSKRSLRTRTPKVFMLWGRQAQAKRELVAAARGCICLLECNHPSPLSARRAPAPFIGCGHFSAANRFLVRAMPGPPVDWGGG